MTPEERAAQICEGFPLETLTDIKAAIAAAIRAAENDALECAALKVISALPGNKLGSVMADLIRLQKHS
jgi:hypothetical protein